MLETLSICEYSSLRRLGGSENLYSAVNQQERPAFAGILRDFTPGPLFEGMIKSELHGDMQE
jgi:hypothetical protein